MLGIKIIFCSNNESQSVVNAQTSSNNLLKTQSTYQTINYTTTNDADVKIETNNGKNAEDTPTLEKLSNENKEDKNKDVTTPSATKPAPEQSEKHIIVEPTIEVSEHKMIEISNQVADQLDEPRQRIYPSNTGVSKSTMLMMACAAIIITTVVIFKTHGDTEKPSAPLKANIANGTIDQYAENNDFVNNEKTKINL
jgi:hypothetical protein